MADVIVLNEIDSAKQELSTQIGTTTNTGGSATAGTLMAKLNALLSSWTAARAGLIDTIRGYTATNNTASSTGTLSQKASAIINKRNASLTGSGITVFSGVADIYADEGVSNKLVAKFIAPVSGVYNVVVTTPIVTASFSSTGYVGKVVDSVVGGSYYTTEVRASAYSISQSLTYNLSSVGAAALVTSSVSFADYLATEGTGRYHDMMLKILEVQASTTGTTSKSGLFYCKAGEPVVLVLWGNISSNAVRINSITVTYQPEY